MNHSDASFTAPGAPLLSFEQVGMRFDSRIGWLGQTRRLQALHDLSFTLRRGEILGVVGESGCGKSTLGKLVMRLLTPTSGVIRYKYISPITPEVIATELLPRIAELKKQASR